MGKRVLAALAIVASACTPSTTVTTASETPATAPASTASATTTSQPPAPATTQPADPIAGGILPLTDDGQPDVAPLAAFVEQQRNGTFSRPPTVRFVETVPPVGPIDRLSELDTVLLKLLGIADADFDEDSATSVGPGEPSGICCPVTIIPADDPLVTAGVIVHELTHLLDRALAQSPPPIAGGLDSAHRTAIVEGNATRVEEAFLANFGTTIQELRDKHGIRQQVPPLVEAAIVFPYTQGRFLAEAIASDGGEAAVNDAYATPPASAEQVMFPDAYFAGELPVDVEATAAHEGTLVRFGTIGPYLLGLAVSEVLSEDARLVLLRNWAGDAYEMRRGEDEMCIDAAVVMDEPDAAVELGAALADAVSLLTVEVEDARLDLSGCIPL